MQTTRKSRLTKLLCLQTALLPALQTRPPRLVALHAENTAANNNPMIRNAFSSCLHVCSGGTEMHTRRQAQVAVADFIDLGFLSDDPAVESWCQNTAIQRMIEADTQVEALGGHGTHPTLAKAAQHAVAAYSLRDLAKVRRACDDLVVAAHRLSAAKPLTPAESTKREEGGLASHEQSHDRGTPPAATRRSRTAGDSMNNEFH